MKRALAAIVVGTLCAAAFVALPSCGPNNEELIREAVTQKYDAYKNADDAVLSQLVSSLENDGLTELGIDETEFATVVVDGFDYAIDNISVEGDSAVITVTFAGKSYEDLLSSISATTEALANDPAFAELSQEDRRAAAGKMVMDAFDALEVRNETVDLDYQLTDNTWQEADEQAGLAQIDNILFAK